MNLLNQDFNLHTHTYRCGHADYIEDQKYIDKLKEIGLTTIGFSEHVPFDKHLIPSSYKRMYITDFDSYVDSINKLKEVNKDITLLAGLECEFDKQNTYHLIKLREKLDYMILGQHYVFNNFTKISRKTNDYPLLYASTVRNAIKSGLFDIIAHPDHFIKFTDKVGNKKEFLNNSIKASHIICETASTYNIPLEINMHYCFDDERLNDGSLAYPSHLFFDIASNYDVKFIKGIDLHELKVLNNFEKDIKKIDDICLSVKDKLLKTYNPVNSRNDNILLNEALEETISNPTYFDKEYTKYLVNYASNNNLSKEELINYINIIKEKDLFETNKVITMNANLILSINANNNILKEEKKLRLKKLNSALDSAIVVLRNRNKLHDEIINELSKIDDYKLILKK